MTLGKSRAMAFVATTRPEVARKFYCEVLGLKLEEDTPFAVVVSAANVKLRIQKVKELTPHPFTALGWEVDEISTAVAALAERGVTFQRFEGMDQDAAGVWSSPSGAKVAWFKDPDGNLLSVTEFG